jgi:hypothetical protein
VAVYLEHGEVVRGFHHTTLVDLAVLVEALVLVVHLDITQQVAVEPELPEDPEKAICYTAEAQEFLGKAILEDRVETSAAMLLLVQVAQAYHLQLQELP